jgi:hypothetical protein
MSPAVPKPIARKKLSSAEGRGMNLFIEVGGDVFPES